MATGQLHLILEGQDFQAVAGWFRTTDPFFTLASLEAALGEAEAAFTSKVITDSLNPRWPQACIPLDALCNGSLEKTIRISVQHWEDTLEHVEMGFANFTVQALLEASADPSKAIKLQLEGGAECPGSIIVRHARLQTPPRDGLSKLLSERILEAPSLFSPGIKTTGSPLQGVANPDAVVRLTLEGARLEAAGRWFSATNPYYEIARRCTRDEVISNVRHEDSEWTMLHRSEAVCDSTNPIWKTATIPMLLLDQGEAGWAQKIRISCFDDAGENPTPMGNFETDILELRLAAGHPEKEFALECDQGNSYGVVRVIEATLPDECEACFSVLDLKQHPQSSRELQQASSCTHEHEFPGMSSSPRTTVWGINTTEDLVDAASGKDVQTMEEATVKLQPPDSTEMPIAAASTHAIMQASLVKSWKEKDDLLTQVEECKHTIANCEERLMEANECSACLRRENDDLAQQKSYLHEQLTATKADAAITAKRLDEAMATATRYEALFQAERQKTTQLEQLLKEKEDIIASMTQEVQSNKWMKASEGEVLPHDSRPSDRDGSKARAAERLAATSATIRNKLGKMLLEAGEEHPQTHGNASKLQPFRGDNGIQTTATTSSEVLVKEKRPSYLSSEVERLEHAIATLKATLRSKTSEAQRQNFFIERLDQRNATLQEELREAHERLAIMEPIAEPSVPRLVSQHANTELLGSENKKVLGALCAKNKLLGKPRSSAHANKKRLPLERALSSPRVASSNVQNQLLERSSSSRSLPSTAADLELMEARRERQNASPIQCNMHLEKMGCGDNNMLGMTVGIKGDQHVLGLGETPLHQRTSRSMESQPSQHVNKALLGSDNKRVLGALTAKNKLLEKLRSCAHAGRKRLPLERVLSNPRAASSNMQNQLLERSPSTRSLPSTAADLELMEVRRERQNMHLEKMGCSDNNMLGMTVGIMGDQHVLGLEGTPRHPRTSRSNVQHCQPKQSTSISFCMQKPSLPQRPPTGSVSPGSSVQKGNVASTSTPSTEIDKQRGKANNEEASATKRSSRVGRRSTRSLSPKPKRTKSGSKGRKRESRRGATLSPKRSSAHRKRSCHCESNSQSEEH